MRKFYLRNILTIFSWPHTINIFAQKVSSLLEESKHGRTVSSSRRISSKKKNKKKLKYFKEREKWSKRYQKLFSVLCDSWSFRNCYFSLNHFSRNLDVSPWISLLTQHTLHLSSPYFYNHRSFLSIELVNFFILPYHLQLNFINLNYDFMKIKSDFIIINFNFMKVKLNFIFMQLNIMKMNSIIYLIFFKRYFNYNISTKIN